MTASVRVASIRQAGGPDADANVRQRADAEHCRPAEPLLQRVEEPDRAASGRSPE